MYAITYDKDVQANIKKMKKPVLFGVNINNEYF